MNKSRLSIYAALVFFTWAALFVACNPNVKNNSNPMNTNPKKGSYGYDLAFFFKNKVNVIELKDSSSESRVLVVPGYQGRVMTSTSKGNEGTSFGWINYNYIEAGKVSQQFNPYGGEERLWLGPEGGPFSIFFKKGDEQVFSNWKVPSEIDTDPFEVTSQGERFVSFGKDFSLFNASGTKMEIGITRSVKILSKGDIETDLGAKIDESLSMVGYESQNTLINKGTAEWTANTGMLSVWMLAMFNPSSTGVVFIPYKTGSVETMGRIVTDDYFGKVPPDRLKITDKTLFFCIDGKFRSKIGISPKRALPYCGSYDPENNTLTLLWYSVPSNPSDYVNSKWGPQENSLGGDVVNSYNDGPNDAGSVLGPFYEIESSSPAGLLIPGASITHVQRIIHISGDEDALNSITQALFNLSIDSIKEAFKK